MTAKPHILIVDDEPRMCDSIKLLLGSRDYEIRTANNGREAIDCFLRHPFDLILLDLVMPEMDGYQVMNEIHRRNPDTLIVILTGHASIKSAVEALKRGAYDYLRKPFEHEDLLKTVKNALDHKQTGAALKDSEIRYKRATEAGQVGVWDFNVKSGELYLDSSLKSMFGYTEFDTADTIEEWLTYLNPEDADRLIHEFIEYHEGQTPEFETTVRMLAKDNRIMRFLLRCTTVRDSGGAPFRLVGTATNVTKQLGAEEALRESEMRFREMADLLPTIICETDMTMRLTYINKAGIDTFGYTQEAIREGVNVTDLIHPADIEKGLQADSRPAAGGTKGGAECRMIDKNGSEMILLISATRIKKEGKTAGIRISMTDFTEQRMLQTQLQQARKMEAIASLSGGIAHEFNNSLMGIVGNIELLEMTFPESEEVRESVEKIMASTDRMAQLTNQLLAYGRGGKYWPEKKTVKEIVNSALASILRATKSSVRIETDLIAGDTVVETDLVQMQMVISAVVANAAEAIETSGRIRIIAENEVFDAARVRGYPGHGLGDYVCLVIEDDGKGMDRETVEKVFEPFFSTKFQGRGLTMAAVYGIIKNHNGWIGVASEKGEGTRVSIHLPVAERTAADRTPIKVKPVSGSGTILNIDDDEMILATNKPVLKKLGYRVLEARTGEEAISIVNSDQHIDVALLNISLPDIRGDQLYPILKKARPDLKVILSSGYGMDAPIKEVLAAGAQGYIHKPYTFAALSVKLKQVLGSRD